MYNIDVFYKRECTFHQVKNGKIIKDGYNRMKGRKKFFRNHPQKIKFVFLEMDLLPFENTLTDVMGGNSTPCSLERGDNKCLYFVV